jgi:hypothetical protein
MLGTWTALPPAKDVWYNSVELAVAAGFEEVTVWVWGEEVGYEMAGLCHG